MTPFTNNGYLTEETHHQKLCDIFGEENVSRPVASSNGSDFRIIKDDKVISIESKYSTEDIGDAGCISMFANGMIYAASAFLTNTHIATIENSVEQNKDQIQTYCIEANTDHIPHMIDVELFKQIKAENKLINITEYQALPGVIESSYVKGNNKFVKANYVIIDTDVFCVSDNKELDPLNLLDKGAVVLGNDHLKYYSVRAGRNGSKNGRASVNIRVQYRLNDTVPKSAVTLENFG